MYDIDYLKTYDGPAVRIMEVCGTHTAAIFRSGIRGFLSPQIRLVSGPGCPVCVTAASFIDRCIDISLAPDHELVCFGDLIKVPGTTKTLSNARGAGGRVRMVWSPFDVLALAKESPGTAFVVAAIGFETTVPAFGLLLEEAAALGLKNLKLLTSLKSAISAIDWICSIGEPIDAFICPGHVSVVTGADAFAPLAEKYGKPFVVAGFEGEHLLAGIKAAVEDAAEGRGIVRNLYPEAVSAVGNKRARAVTEKYFSLGDAEWRGLGTIAGSGYFFRDSSFDAESLIASAPLEPRNDGPVEEATGCKCRDVILGRIDPDECPLFGSECTPERAVGPCMVSAEGACGTWYRSAR